MCSIKMDVNNVHANASQGAVPPAASKGLGLNVDQFPYTLMLKCPTSHQKWRCLQPGTNTVMSVLMSFYDDCTVDPNQVSNHLSWLLSTWGTSCSTPSSSRTTELLALSLRVDWPPKNSFWPSWTPSKQPKLIFYLYSDWMAHSSDPRAPYSQRAPYRISKGTWLNAFSRSRKHMWTE